MTTHTLYFLLICCQVWCLSRIIWLWTRALWVTMSHCSPAYLSFCYWSLLSFGNMVIICSYDLEHGDWVPTQPEDSPWEAQDWGRPHADIISCWSAITAKCCVFLRAFFTHQHPSQSDELVALEELHTNTHTTAVSASSSQKSNCIVMHATWEPVLGSLACMLVKNTVGAWRERNNWFLTLPSLPSPKESACFHSSRLKSKLP